MAPHGYDPMLAAHMGECEEHILISTLEVELLADSASDRCRDEGSGTR